MDGGGDRGDLTDRRVSCFRIVENAHQDDHDHRDDDRSSRVTSLSIPRSHNVGSIDVRCGATMANASIRSPGSVKSFKWTIAHLRASGVPDRHPCATQLNQTAPTACLIVFIGTESAASVVEALNLATRDNVDASPGTIEGELSIDLLASTATSVQPAAASRSLASIASDHIQRVLLECGGNKSEAARRLRITRRTLQRRLKLDASSEVRAPSVVRHRDR